MDVESLRRTYCRCQPHAWSWSLAGLMALVLLVGACQGPSGSGGTRPAKYDIDASFSTEDWSFGKAEGVKLTSPHYVIYTTCRYKPFVNALPGFLETCRAAYAELLFADVEAGRRLDVYLFQTRWQWEKFTEQFNPERAEVYKRIRSGGYSERGVTVSHYGSQRTALSVLAHEGLHQYLELTRGSNVPPWLNEGLAAYFEAFDIDAQTNRPIFKPETNYLRTGSLREALVSGGLLPLPRLLATHAGIEVQERSSHVRTYYAQVWSLVLFLIRSDLDNPYREEFLELLREAGTDAMDRRARAFLATDTEGQMSYGEAVFRAYITDDLEAFQAAHEAYLHKFLKLQ